MSRQSELNAALRSSLGGVQLATIGIAGVVAVFLAVPLMILVPVAFSSNPFLTWPPDLASTRWFEAFFTSPIWTNALTKSVTIALPVAAIATVLGTLSAVGLSYARRGRRTLKTLFIAPVILPLVTYALGLYDVSQRLGLAGSTIPVIVGQAMLAAPMAFVIVSSGIAGRDPQLPQAASSLGARAWSVLWNVELPLLRGPIAAAALMSLAYSFDEIVVAYFLSPPGGGTLPVQILQTTRETADPTIAAASLIVIAIVAPLGALIVLGRTLTNRRKQ